MAQPDLSEALVIILVAVAMYFVAGASVLQFVIGILGGTGAFVLVVRQIPAAMERIMPFLVSWQDPMVSTNRQLRQGVIALGSGGIFGVGPGSGLMSHQWLPAAHTDSIFAIVGEELGMIGCLTLIGLYALLALRGYRIVQLAPDKFGRFLALGVTCWITFQAVINMAVVTGTIPFTGIALPFISVGGSSLVTCMLGVGIMLSVSRAVKAEGAERNEAGDSRRRDRGARVPSPGRRRSPA
jgi:cell division protein FtsW